MGKIYTTDNGKRCSGYGIYPGGRKCKGCGDCKGRFLKTPATKKQLERLVRRNTKLITIKK